MAGEIQKGGCKTTQPMDIRMRQLTGKSIWKGSSPRCSWPQWWRDFRPCFGFLRCACWLQTIYVDDMLAAGRPEALKQFWAQLAKHIEIGAPSDVDRFLGRYHRLVDSTTVFLHMGDYARQAIDLYTSLPGSKPLKGTDTPYVPEGSLPLEDWQVKGELSQSSAKIPHETSLVLSTVQARPCSCHLYLSSSINHLV